MHAFFNECNLKSVKNVIFLSNHDEDIRSWHLLGFHWVPGTVLCALTSLALYFHKNPDIGPHICYHSSDI